MSGEFKKGEATFDSDDRLFVHCNPRYIITEKGIEPPTSTVPAD